MPRTTGDHWLAISLAVDTFRAAAAAASAATERLAASLGLAASLVSPRFATEIAFRDEMFSHHLVRRWPCPGTHHVNDDGCLPVSGTIHREEPETVGQSPSLFRRLLMAAGINYECGCRREVPPEILHHELVRINWDPDIEWTTTYEKYRDASGVRRPDLDTTTVTGETTCVHGAERLAMNATYTVAYAAAANIDLRRDAVDVVRRGILLSDCSCVPPESSETLEDYVVSRWVEHGELHDDVRTVRRRGNLAEPHSGEWVERPEMLDGPLRLDVSSDYTSVPEESVAFDAGPGATLEDLGIHLEGRIDRATEIIDRALDDEP